MNNKGGVRKVKEVRGIVHHAILLTRVIEDKRVEEELSGMKCADAEEICNHQVGDRRLLRASKYGGCVIQTGVGRGHECFWDCSENSGLVENEGRELKGGVGEVFSQLGVLDQVVEYVWGSEVMPHDAVAGLGGVDPHSSCPQAQGITEPQMGGISEDNIGQVSGPNHFMLREVPPVRNLLVKGCQNPGPLPPPLVQITLNVVNVCHRPWH